MGRIEDQGRGGSFVIVRLPNGEQAMDDPLYRIGNGW